MKKINDWMHSKKGVLWTLGILFVILLVINCNTIWAADDFAFYNKTWIQGDSFSLLQVFQAASSFYLTWTGRFLSSFVNYIILYFDKSLFNILNSLVYLAFIYLMYRIVQKERKANAYLLILIFLLTWFFIPAVGQVMFWQIGSVIYLWMMTLVLLVTFFYVNWLRGNSKLKDHVWSWLGIFVLSVLAGNGFETNSIVLIVFLTLSLGYQKFVQKKKIPIWAWIGWVGSILGFATNFFSPGNAVRMEQMGGSSDSFIWRIFYALGPWFYNGIYRTKLFILIPILIGIYLLYVLSKKKDRTKFWNTKTIFAYASMALFSFALMALCIYYQKDSVATFLNWFYPNSKIFVLSLLVLAALCAGSILLFFLFRKHIFKGTEKEVNGLTACFVLAAAVGVCSYIMTPTAWPRSYMGMCTFLLLAILFLIERTKVTIHTKWLSYLPKAIFIVLFVGWIASFSFAMKDMLAAKTWQKETDQYIKEQIALGETEIHVKTFVSTNDYNAASIEKWVIPIVIEDKELATENGIHRDYEWINQAITNYYFKDRNAWQEGKRIVGYE